MSRNDIITLKLQMGIDPAVKIEPNILRAMWQQLQFERVNARRNQYGSVPRSKPVTTNPMVV